MSNIYELFEQRKEGISMLEEGYGYIDPDDSMDFDTVEEGLYALEDLTMEVTNGVIKLLAENYITDLCLEEAMDDDFDDFIENDYLSESIKEKAGNAKEWLAEKWRKFKGWVLRMIENVKNLFLNREQFFKKYKNMGAKFKEREGTLKLYEFKPSKTAIESCEALVDKVRTSATGDDFDISAEKGFKEKCFAEMGIKDMKELKKTVRGYFINGDDKVTKKYSEMNSTVIIDYAQNKKTIIDGIKKFEKVVDADFRATQQSLKETIAGEDGDAKKSDKKILSAFNFMFKLKTTVINLAINNVKSISTACFNICKLAVGGSKGDEALVRATEKKQLKDEKKAGRKAIKDIKKAKKNSSDEGDEATNESFDFEVVSDYDDDYYW